MTLAVWFGRSMGARIAAALVALTAVLQLVDLFEAAPRLMDEGRGVAALVQYAMLRTPHLLLEAAPVGVLAGALFGFSRLGRDQATTTLRAAGVSAYRLVLLALPAALGAAVLMLVLSAWGAPRSDEALAAWLRRGAPAAGPLRPGPDALRRTFRLGNDIVTASPADGAGRRLSAVEIYGRADDGRLVRHVSARTASLEGRRWRLHKVTWETYGPALLEPGSADALAWTDRLDPADVRSLFEKDAGVTPAAARRALAGGAAPRPLSTYRMLLDRIWAGPAAAVVMLMIAAPAAMGQGRDGGAVRLSLASLAGGLLFLVTDGVLTALGAGGAVPPLLAAWAAPVLFATGAAVALLNLEG